VASDDANEVSTVLQHRFQLSPAPDGGFALVVIDGPDTGARVLVAGDAPRVLIGQGPACDFRLTDRSVSRRHAQLELCGQRLRVLDLGSKNGTYAGSIAIADAFLAGGETLTMGATVFRVERDDSAPTPSLRKTSSFGRLVGASREIRRLYPLFSRLAASDVPVLIEGETGTGKEVLAESLHLEGVRASGPFIVFDCTEVPPSLVESELFGHEKGAFTGAVSARTGLVEQANGGTLFIDEIGDLEPSLQPKLLRALERREIRRVGGDRRIPVDVRILAATRRDLDREVQAGRFRDDLYHRLVVARVELPALRTRKGDIAVLARHFCRELDGDPATLDSTLLSRWDEYAWPGNARELRNAVARFLALRGLPEGYAQPAPVGANEAAAVDFLDGVLSRRLPLVEARQQVVAELEQRYIARVLAEHDGNVTRAAAASGIALRHFQRLRARSPR
jgi:DNA-binding NtrC family response regulator